MVHLGKNESFREKIWTGLLTNLYMVFTLYENVIELKTLILR